MFFIRPDADITSLLTLCNLPSKSEVEKYCRSLTIRQCDFVSFILHAQSGVFDPYKYACAFRDRQPPHLIPTADERAAFGASGVGPLQGKAKKVLYKMSQMLRDRRALAAHLFYTPDHAHWSLFYCDQRDTLTADNHWEHGPHLHFVSSIWVRIEAGTVYQQVTNGKCRFPSVHIRFHRPTSGFRAGPGRRRAGH
jgi:hypothetical protein